MSRVGNGVLLQPVASEAAEWFAALDRLDDPFTCWDVEVAQALRITAFVESR